MKNDLRLLAYVPTLIEPVRAYCKTREGRFQYFREGFVSLDLGRHTHQTDAIMEALAETREKGTKQFALADKAGKVIGRYSSLANAETARDNAVIRVQPELEIESDEGTDQA